MNKFEQVWEGFQVKKFEQIHVWSHGDPLPPFTGRTDAHD